MLFNSILISYAAYFYYPVLVLVYNVIWFSYHAYVNFHVILPK